MSDCTHDCSTCSKKDCSEKKDFKEKQNEQSNVKKVIGIVSGKGGVGKSLVTSLLSVLTAKNGYKVGVLDADITGPSIPKVFGIKGKATSLDGKFITPIETSLGIKGMVLMFFVPHPVRSIVEMHKNARVFFMLILNSPYVLTKNSR